MNATLSLTFNLTAAMFLAVWSPFFILSMVDLVSDLVGRRVLRPVNFGLRCTLLIIGSAKPMVYLICLKRFRDAWKCIGLFGGTVEPSSESSTVKPEDVKFKSTKIIQLTSTSQTVLRDHDKKVDSVLSFTNC